MELPAVLLGPMTLLAGLGEMGEVAGGDMLWLELAVREFWEVWRELMAMGATTLPVMKQYLL